MLPFTLPPGFVRRSAGLAFTLALGSLAAAQGHVWVVDDDGGAGVDFTKINAAIQAAADGDTILVRDGVYQPAVTNDVVIPLVGRSLVVAADKGAHVVVRDDATALGISQSLRIENVAAGQQVVVRGIDFELANVPFSTIAAPTVFANAGSVRLEDCTFRSHGFFMGHHLIHVAGTTSLVLERCELRSIAAVYPTLLVEGSNVSCYDTAIAAGSMPPTAGPANGGKALQAAGSRIRLSGGRLVGGDGLDGGTTIFGCLNGGDGGDALVAEDSDVVLEDVLLIPGAPGAAAELACAAGKPGEALRVTGGTLTTLDAAPPRIEIASPIRAGHAARIVFDAPGRIAFALLSTQPAALELAPFGELLVTNPAVLAFSGTVPAWGKTVMLPVGALVPGAEAALYHVQGAFLDPAAGTVRLGNATAVTLLDASL